MTIQEAIEARHSVRAYKEQPLTTVRRLPAISRSARVRRRALAIR